MAQGTILSCLPPLPFSQCEVCSFRSLAWLGTLSQKSPSRSPLAQATAHSAHSVPARTVTQLLDGFVSLNSFGDREEGGFLVACWPRSPAESVSSRLRETIRREASEEDTQQSLACTGMCTHMYPCIPMRIHIQTHTWVIQGRRPVSVGSAHPRLKQLCLPARKANGCQWCTKPGA